MQVILYAYALNYPLKYTDPSGYKIGILAQTASGLQDDYPDLHRWGGGGNHWPKLGTLATANTGPSSFEEYVFYQWQNSFGTFDAIVNTLLGITDDRNWFANYNLSTGELTFDIEDFLTIHPTEFSLILTEMNEHLLFTLGDNFLAGNDPDDRMGFQINWGFGYGVKSSFGSLMLKFSTAPLFSSELDLISYSATNQKIQNQIHLISLDAAYPIINLGGNMSLIAEYGSLKLDYGFSVVGLNFNNRNGFYSGFDWGLHFGIIGVEGYLRSNDMFKPVKSFHNARQSFYEQTGGFIPWR